MLTEPILFTGKLTLEDVVDMDHYRFLCVLGRPIRILMGVFSALLASVIVLLILKLEARLFLIFVLVLCAYYPFGWVLTRRSTVARYYRRHADHYVEVTATFTNEAVLLNSVPVDVRLDWKRLSRICSTSRGLLFMLPPYQAWFWLPQCLFEENDHKAAILAMAAEHKVPVKQMT